MKGLATAAITFSKRLLAQALAPGEIAVDATAGNGNDTVFLAGLVAPGGVVHGFDIQESALARTRDRLAAAGLAQAAVLHATGHEHLAAVLPETARGRVRAVTFNLGFLPGGDASVVTLPGTTLAALDAACAVLAPDGVISVVCYTGHAGGRDEAAQVGAWCAGLDFAGWRVARYELANKPGDPILSYFIEKRG